MYMFCSLSNFLFQKPEENNDEENRRRKSLKRVWRTSVAAVKVFLKKQGIVDIIALVMFPFIFFVFNCIYWSHYVGQRNTQWEELLKEFQNEIEDDD